ncbi:uncharacterized protein M421DRAFT_403292 [Didymella exigua CBS 183.55]|uniref:Uncharacterized protein n=1 Tax=Didymella exigua CBS 183.55 TaxID=1150837 RepID=A0A6A5RVD2_9PLEO|nr:uncharacterized protein M421DRAFT_403292 [Didymella exigua CBS 183.55]KAF1932421.1 hypothetical protein M421DRAFT_403292 [Didymella exigua CBS 183.55]
MPPARPKARRAVAVDLVMFRALVTFYSQSGITMLIPPAGPSAIPANTSCSSPPRLQTFSPLPGPHTGTTLAAYRGCKGPYAALSSALQPTSLPSASLGYSHGHVDGHERPLLPVPKEVYQRQHLSRGPGTGTVPRECLDDVKRVKITRV